MFTRIDGVKIISSFRQAFDVSAYFARRPSHGMQLMLEGSCRFRFQSGEDFVLGENQLLFIPRGSSYQIDVPEKGQPVGYAFINFLGHIQGAVPRRFECRSLDEVKLLFERILTCQLSPTLFDYYQQLALFYQVLALLALSDSDETNIVKARRTIQPALDFLRKNTGDPALRVDSLHELCFVSSTQFRKLFRIAEGTTPRKYVSDLRLGRAKQLIEEGKYSYLYEVAEAVGYEDALYFSRLFKQKYGYAPSLEDRMRMGK